MVDSEPRQENIIIGGVEVPVIHYEGDVWYPANYINRCILKRKNSMITKENEHKIEGLWRIFNINFEFIRGGIQSSKCMKQEGFYILLKHTRIGDFNNEQKYAYNELIRHLGLDIPLLLEGDNIPKTELNKIIKNYNIFVKDCIEVVLSLEPNINWRRCNRCGNIYPLHTSFFKIDNNKNIRREIKYLNFCKDCGEDNNKITHPNQELNDVYRRYGEEFYVSYKNHNIIKIYEYCKSNYIQLPKLIKNKEDYLHIIKYYYIKGHIDKDKISYDYLVDNFQLENCSRIATLDQIYTYLFGEDFKEFPWKYKSYSLNDVDFNKGKIIFDNYLKENNIIINDILTFDYSNIINKSHLRGIFGTNTLEFIVKYNDYKYGGYKFDTSGTNYYRVKENRIFDMKYFIEEDMKVPIDKIPLYITKNVLQKRARTLYSLLNNGKYYKNLYEWVNEIYPDKFIESDFVIGNYRDEFDSVEENQINDILHSYFDSVIYNQLNTDRTIKFSGKTPDWFIFTDKGCILVEYFGLYIPQRAEGSSVIRDYIQRSDKKKEIYSKLVGYKLLYFYPEDIENNFEGVRRKIKNILN